MNIHQLFTTKVIMQTCMNKKRKLKKELRFFLTLKSRALSAVLYLSPYVVPCSHSEYLRAISFNKTIKQRKRKQKHQRLMQKNGDPCLLPCHRHRRWGVTLSEEELRWLQYECAFSYLEKVQLCLVNTCFCLLCNFCLLFSGTVLSVLVHFNITVALWGRCY